MFSLFYLLFLSVQTCPVMYLFIYLHLYYIYKGCMFWIERIKYIGFFYIVYVHKQIEPFWVYKKLLSWQFCESRHLLNRLTQRINKVTQNTTLSSSASRVDTLGLVVLVGQTVSPNPQTNDTFQWGIHGALGQNDRLKDKEVTENTLQSADVGRRNAWTLPSQGELFTVQTWTLEN